MKNARVKTRILIFPVVLNVLPIPQQIVKMHTKQEGLLGYNQSNDAVLSDEGISNTPSGNVQPADYKDKKSSWLLYEYYL